MDYTVATCRQGGPAALEGDNFTRVHASRIGGVWRIAVGMIGRDGEERLTALL